MNEIIHTELQPGTTLCSGKYRIERVIGAGGFGITYLAIHTALGGRFAIKEFFWDGYNIRNNTTNRIGLHGIDVEIFNKVRQDFTNEAQTLATLNHDSVVKVIDKFDENGTSYMVMPFVEGTTLQKMVEKDGPLKYELAVNYIVQICDALAYIHSKNILHRDVTPENIIVTPGQKIVLIDFGTARKFINNKTQRHTRMAKDGYAPLEQHSEISKKGAYTDLYALGAVFYFILTGVRPIDATERTLEVMKEPCELNHMIPKQINAVIMKAMAMSSAERYQSAMEMEEDIMSGDMPRRTTARDISSHDGTPKTKMISWINSPLVRKVAAITMSILAVLALFAAIGSLHKEPASETAEVQDSISVNPVEGVPVALNRVLEERSDTLMNRLEDNHDDAILLYAIARKAFEYGCTESMNRFWNNVLVPEGNVTDYIHGGDISGPKFAYVCAARAYICLPESGYDPVVRQELRDSLVILMEQINNKRRLNGKKVYQEQ